jgi:hypothetical protein
VEWILGKEIKELVNSARISAVQSGKIFTWIHAREETLKSMTDITLTARFLALARLKRAQGTTAKLWISQVLTHTTCPYPTTGVFVPGTIGGPDVCTGDHGF